MCEFLTKKKLYEKINSIRGYLKIDPHENKYPLDVYKICLTLSDISVDEISFNTKGLQGMTILPSQPNEQKIILLNSNQSPAERNFYCSHELIHAFLHNIGDSISFNCFDLQRPQQNSFVEWQANEGAAELLMPYKEVLLMAGKLFRERMDLEDILSLKRDMALRFNVTEAMVNVRLESLQYEIWQYIRGIPISNIRILSKKKQTDKGIIQKSLNTIEQELLDLA